jgi:hypothetical protein
VGVHRRGVGRPRREWRVYGVSRHFLWMTTVRVPSTRMPGCVSCWR